MIEKGKKTALLTKYGALVSPYLAVWLGLYTFHNAWAALGIYYAMILAAIWCNAPRSLIRQFVRGLKLRWALMGMLLCFGVCPLILRFWPIAKLPDVQIQSLLQTYGLSRPSALVFALVAVAFNPLLEEGFWRGLFTPDPRKPAWIDVIFSGYHFFILLLAIDWGFALTGILALMSFGWTMRAIQHRLGGLAVPVLAHLAADAGIVTAVILLLQQAE